MLISISERVIIDNVKRDKDAEATLRSLSSTSQRLREFTLSLVWRCVEINTVKKLGALRDLIGTSQKLAHAIKYFSFEWNMGGDSRSAPALAAGPRSLLELAFCDRMPFWEDLRAKHGKEITFEKEYQGFSSGSFLHRGKAYVAPGRFQGRVTGDAHSYDYNHTGGSGPDGKGEDARIRNPCQLESCLVDVLTRLTSLEEFMWDTPVMPLPRGAVPVLAARKTLARLDITLHLDGGFIHDCEYDPSVCSDCQVGAH